MNSSIPRRRPSTPPSPGWMELGRARTPAASRAQSGSTACCRRFQSVAVDESCTAVDVSPPAPESVAGVEAIPGLESMSGWDASHRHAGVGGGIIVARAAVDEVEEPPLLLQARSRRQGAGGRWVQMRVRICMADVTIRRALPLPRARAREKIGKRSSGSRGARPVRRDCRSRIALPELHSRGPTMSDTAAPISPSRRRSRRRRRGRARTWTTSPSSTGRCSSSAASRRRAPAATPRARSAGSCTFTSAKRRSASAPSPRFGPTTTSSRRTATTASRWPRA